MNFKSPGPPPFLVASRKSRPDPLLPPSPSTPTFDCYANTPSPVSSTPTRTGNRKPMSPLDNPTPTSSWKAFLIWRPSRKAPPRAHLRTTKALDPRVPALLPLASSPHTALHLPRLPVSITCPHTLPTPYEDHPHIDAHLHPRLQVHPVGPDRNSVSAQSPDLQPWRAR